MFTPATLTRRRDRATVPRAPARLRRRGLVRAELGGEPGRPCARLPARSPSARLSQAPARFPPVGPGPPPDRVPSARPSPLLRPPATSQRGPLFLKARLS